MAADLVWARAAAEQFRARVITGKPFDRLPLDTHFIADVVLKMDLIPFPGLTDLLDAAAALKPNLREMYVDDDLSAASSDRHAKDWELNRLRFSIAHELGHIEMHAGQVEETRCQAIGDMIALFGQNDAARYDREKEANEFAGRLLVNADKLKEALDAFGKLQADPKWRDSAQLRGDFCKLLTPRFGINQEGLRLRLDRESLWPAEWTQGG